MKRISYVYLASLLIVVFAISSCTGLKKMKKMQSVIKYTLLPNPLEMHADSVVINVTGKFPEKYYKKKVTCEITPVLKSTSGTEIPLKMIKVQGEKVQDNNPVIKNLGGGSFTYTDKVAYTQDMRVCDVNVKIHAVVKKKFADFDPVTIGQGTIATSGLLEKDSKAIAAKDKFVRIIPETKEAQIMYLINQSNVRPGELNKDEMKTLKKYLAATQTNVRKEIKGVKISSYASPDGTEELNAKLSTNRGTSGTTTIKGELKKYGKAKAEGFFSEKATAEDWDGFQSLMQASDIADKDLIIRVLSMYSDPVQREKEIKNLSKAYTQVADKVLPKLRRSVLTVNVDSIGRSDDELNSAFDTLPTILSVEELLYTATLTKDLNRQLKIYQATSSQYPNDWRGFNNVGFVLIAQNNNADAKSQFEKAKTINAGNTIILNNLGACALRDGDFVKAEEYFKSANGAGTEVNYNLGICAVKKADYAGAVTYFGTYCSFNAALAKLLSGNADAATKAIDCAEDKDRDMMYYLKAVIGARQANTDLMYNSLRAAINKNANLTNAAKTDMEFVKYFSDDTFKTIVK